MKKISITLLLITAFIAFSIFVTIRSKSYTVVSVETPTKFSVKADFNKKSNKTENICIAGVETFSLELDEEQITRYFQLFNLTREETISLGYLAQEYAEKALLNQKVTLKYDTDVSKDCKYATVYIHGANYKASLSNSGFGISNNEILNQKKFNKNLNKARKLNLVILNHHSGKYHTLDCPYGLIAHDRIILPKSQLPENTIPCKFCNNQSSKALKINRDIFDITNIIQPNLFINHNVITAIMTDFTQTLKPNNKCSNIACKELVKQIDNANSNIDIAIYGYRKIPAITEALKRAKNRGVTIRFIYDSYFNPDKNYYPHNKVIEDISNETRSDKTSSDVLSNMLMHNKFIIFDNKKVFTGSMNISSTGTSGYDVNSAVVIDSTEIANLYTKEFEQMLSGKFHTEKSKITNNQKFNINDSEIEVYFSPKDKTANRIVELINEATTYIYAPTFLVTHSEISNALIEAKNRGVDVRIIIDANSVTTRSTKHAKLRRAGVLLKTENYAGKMHAKSIIIDDKYFITGSMNLSYSGTNRNDENTVIIKDSEIAKFHKNIFLYFWTKVPNKYLKKNAKPESPDSIGSCIDGVDNNFNDKVDKGEIYCSD